MGQGEQQSQESAVVHDSTVYPFGVEVITDGLRGEIESYYKQRCVTSKMEEGVNEYFFAHKTAVLNPGVRVQKVVVHLVYFHPIESQGHG